MAWVSQVTMPSFTNTFQEQPPVQFTPWVLRTMASCWERLR